MSRIIRWEAWGVQWVNFSDNDWMEDMKNLISIPVKVASCISGRSLIFESAGNFSLFSLQLPVVWLIFSPAQTEHIAPALGCLNTLNTQTSSRLTQFLSSPSEIMNNEVDLNAGKFKSKPIKDNYWPHFFSDQGKERKMIPDVVV